MKDVKEGVRVRGELQNDFKFADRHKIVVQAESELILE